MTQTPSDLPNHGLPKHDFLCIGSVLWDVVGRSSQEMMRGADQGGAIERLPGGVAFNIAMMAKRFGLQPALLSAVGQDPAGGELIAHCDALGLITTHITQSPIHPTDSYMAIEDPSGLIAAIADARSLEKIGSDILGPLKEGTLGTAQTPYQGVIAVDGNLTDEVLINLAKDKAFSAADLRVVSASPGKATRLTAFLTGAATLYVNLGEAQRIAQQNFTTAEHAANGLIAKGAKRAIVSDGANLAADADQEGCVTARPPHAEIKRVTGAGDTMMAAHLAAEKHGRSRAQSLQIAVNAAALFVGGHAPELAFDAPAIESTS